MSKGTGDGKIVKSFKKLKRYWSAPAEGRYMPIKEIAAYGGGGMGFHFMFSVIASAINAQMLPYMYGITPTNAYIIVTVVSFINLMIMPLFYNVFDNLRSKKGKFRTFLGILAPLLAIMTVVSTFAPQFQSQTARTIYAYFSCVPVLILSGLVTNIYNMMPAALTPNSQERSDMLSPASLLYSFAPTIIGWVFNPIRGVFQQQGKEYMAYRILGIVFAIVGVALAFVVVKFTKEKVFVTATTKEKAPLRKSLKEIMRNVPFLIICISGIFATFKGLFDVNIVYMYNYRFSEVVGTGNKLSFLISLTGEMATITMIAVPFMTRKISKKALTIFALLSNGVVMFILACIGIQNIPIGTWSIVAIFIVKSLFMLNVGMLVIIGPAMLSDVYDYQQHISGRRLEGSMSTVAGYIGIIGVVLGIITPIIQEKMGFMPGDAIFMPGKPEYDPSYVMPIFTRWMNTTLWISASASILSAIPYFFYTLTEKRHKEIMNELKEQSKEYQEEGGDVDDVTGIDLVEEEGAIEGEHIADVNNINASEGEDNNDIKLDNDIVDIIQSCDKDIIDIANDELAESVEIEPKAENNAEAVEDTPKAEIEDGLNK